MSHIRGMTPPQKELKEIQDGVIDSINIVSDKCQCPKFKYVIFNTPVEEITLLY